MSEKYITLHDFCDAHEGRQPMLVGAKEILEEEGSATVVCLSDKTASEIDLNDIGMNEELVAANLAIRSKIADCFNCTNTDCSFRRGANPRLLETQKDQYYQPTERAKKFLSQS